MFCKKVVLRNFAKLTEKDLCQSLFLNKVAGLPRLAASVNCVSMDLYQIWWLVLEKWLRFQEKIPLPRH